MLRCFHILIALTLLLFTPTSFREVSANAKNTSDLSIPSERSALLSFRSGLSDPGNLLSSWKLGNDCCQWKGVRCSDETGHVIELHLQGRSCKNDGALWHTTTEPGLGGDISSSLLGLQQLQYLDLSCNNFNGSLLPDFLGSLSNLRYLDLSESRFVGMVPPQLGNLSNLHYLTVAFNSDGMYATDITWLSRLSSLEHLDMSSVNLSMVVDWLLVVNTLPSLRFLCLFDCQLSRSVHSVPYYNLTSLQTLDISLNKFNKSITPNWFWDLTALRYLRIGSNYFHGPFPYEIGNMTSIVELDLSSNNLVGMIPPNLQNLCNLEIFVSSGNNINGSITELFRRLPRCSWNKLQDLFLPDCNLTGSLPTTLEPLSNLSRLELGYNNLTGPVPIWIGELTSLETLGLNFNSLDGVIHEGHLASLARLLYLSLSNNNNIAITVNSTWIPPFSLTEIQLRSCRLGPKFPTWLRWQTQVFNLDISNTSISDKVPDWFWIAVSSTSFLNMRNNQITGVLPSMMEFMRTIAIDLSSNQFTGPVPKLPVYLTDLDISKNNLSGSLPSDLGAPALRSLILYGNSISGTIPSSLCKMQSLELLDISGNKLTGPIPDCTVNSSSENSTCLSIYSISLMNNKLSGQFSSFFQNCKNLVFLDLAHNQFSGALPAWIGEKLSSLVFLRLRSNNFSGRIPDELTNLVALQYLDLAHNNFYGGIPNSLAKFHRMTLKQDEEDRFSRAIQYKPWINDNEFVDYIEKLTVVTKGQELLYTGEIIYMVNIDLSSNNLTGEIAEEITTLVALTNLNLSWNRLNGQIPKKIGSLSQLESIDMSHNMLSGEIPNSITSLTYLSHMNLSYNNLSGRIPIGNQLKVLDDPASIYVGNIGLCGPPLPDNCSVNGDISPVRKYHEDELVSVSFYLGMIIGFLVALLTVFYLMLFSKRWRNTFYVLVDGSYDRMYIHVAVTCRKLCITS